MSFQTQFDSCMNTHRVGFSVFCDDSQMIAEQLQSRNVPYLIATIPSTGNYPLVRNCEIRNFSPAQYLHWMYICISSRVWPNGIFSYSPFLNGSTILSLINSGIVVVLLDFHHANKFVQIELHHVLDTANGYDSDDPTGNLIVASHDLNDLINITQAESSPMYLQLGLQIVGC